MQVDLADVPKEQIHNSLRRGQDHKAPLRNPRAAECHRDRQVDQVLDLHLLDVECRRVDLREDQVLRVRADLHHQQRDRVECLRLLDQDHREGCLLDEHSPKCQCKDRDHKANKDLLAPEEREDKELRQE